MSNPNDQVAKQAAARKRHRVTAQVDGDALLMLREGLGLTQQQLADKSRVGVSLIGRAEKGENIEPRMLRAIAEALDVPEASLKYIKATGIKMRLETDSKRVTRAIFTLTGSLARLNQEARRKLAASFLAGLENSGFMSNAATVIEFENGSIRVIVDMSTDDANRIKQAFESGELDYLGIVGFEIAGPPPMPARKPWASFFSFLPSVFGLLSFLCALLGFHPSLTWYACGAGFVFAGVGFFVAHKRKASYLFPAIGAAMNAVTVLVCLLMVGTSVPTTVPPKVVPEKGKDVVKKDTDKKPDDKKVKPEELNPDIQGAMRAQAQVDAVGAALRKLNPGFDGDVKLTARDRDVVKGIQFFTDNVLDISPVRELKELEALDCSASKNAITPMEKQNWLSSLAPLSGMRLLELKCNHTQVATVAPLKDMDLTKLEIYSTPLKSLAPLAGNKTLIELNCSYTDVTDLSPVIGMPLVQFSCRGLKGEIDLNPLKGMQLKDLVCNDAKVSHLEVIESMPLERLYVDFDPKRDTKLLRSFDKLHSINGMPAKQFLDDNGEK